MEKVSYRDTAYDQPMPVQSMICPLSMKYSAPVNVGKKAIIVEKLIKSYL